MSLYPVIFTICTHLKVKKLSLSGVSLHPVSLYAGSRALLNWRIFATSRFVRSFRCQWTKKPRICGSTGNDTRLPANLAFDKSQFINNPTFWHRSSTTSAFGVEFASLYRFSDPIVVAEDVQHRRRRVAAGSRKCDSTQRKRRMWLCDELEQQGQDQRNFGDNIEVFASMRVVSRNADRVGWTTILLYFTLTVTFSHSLLYYPKPVWRVPH